MLRSNDGFAEFWPDYLRAHRKTGTRICHYIATLWGVSLGLYGIATLQIWYAIAAIVGGYALAVGSPLRLQGWPVTGTAGYSPGTVVPSWRNLRAEVHPKPTACRLRRLRQHKPLTHPAG